MHFKYCPDCGALLSSRVLGDEGAVPWCDGCSRPWFDMFPVAVIALVYNRRGEVLLLRQNYISTEFHNLVSGYVTPGEDAETCARREIMEETGQEVEQLELVLSSEVDAAAWHHPSEIASLLSPRPWSTSRILASRFLDRNRDC